MAEVQVIIRAIDKMTPTTTKVRSGLGGLVDQFKSAALVMAGVVAAGYAVKKVYDATVGSLVAYNKSILDSARAVGIATDEFSRIVQMADDFGVSMESVTTALAMATKRGFAPSVESLAQLADRVNGIADPTKRAAELAKVFGKNWAALDPLLQQGGTAIRNMSAAVKDGLVATEAEVQASEELRIELDALKDSTTALTNTIGNEAVPMFTSMADFLIRIIDAAEGADGSILKFLVTMSRSAEARDQTKELADWLKKVEEHSGRAATGIGGMKPALEDVGAEAEAAFGKFEYMWSGIVPPSAEQILGGFMDDLALMLNPANAKAIADQGFIQEMLLQGLITPEAARVLGEVVVAEFAQGMVAQGEMSKNDAVSWIQDSLGSATTWREALKVYETNYATPVWQQLMNITKPHEVPLELKTVLKDALPSSWRLDLKPINLKGFQNGGSFLVPGTGTGDRPYVVQLEPGERVDVTPRNQVRNFTFNTTVADGTDGAVLLSKLNEASRRA